MNKKFEEIKKRIEYQCVVDFNLFNATYRITLIKNKYYIEQMGINRKEKYNSLEELFENFGIYGNNLIELLDVIALV